MNYTADLSSYKICFFVNVWSFNWNTKRAMCYLAVPHAGVYLLSYVGKRSSGRFVTPVQMTGIQEIQAYMPIVRNAPGQVYFVIWRKHWCNTETLIWQSYKAIGLQLQYAGIACGCEIPPLLRWLILQILSNKSIEHEKEAVTATLHTNLTTWEHLLWICMRFD